VARVRPYILYRVLRRRAELQKRIARKPCSDPAWTARWTGWFTNLTG
jgi:hypothetical protein